MADDKVRVFIGSSSQVRQYQLALVDKLLRSPSIEVVRWDSDQFRTGGQFFLDTLLNAAAEKDLDFAVFIFSEDDAIKSTEKIYYTPRDNVLFELGLFMGKLGKERTFVLAPKPWQSKLKILSDLQGYIPELYSKPNAATTKLARLRNLKKVLKPTVADIKARMERLGPRDPQRADQVAWLAGPIKEYFRLRKNAGAVIKNYALDLGETWGIYQTLLADSNVHDVTIKTLMMDGTSDEIAKASGRSPNWHQALYRQNQILGWCAENARKLKKRRIRFECRAYSRVPYVHGFLLKGYKLFLTTLLFDSKGKMVGNPNPYWDIDYPKPRSRNRTVRHAFEAYEAWFDKEWAAAGRVWPK